MTLSDKLLFITGLKDELARSFFQKEWDQPFLEQVKLDFTYYSNKLEGNMLTYGQTLQILRDLTAPKDANLGEVVDIINHKKVLDIVFRQYRSSEISEKYILELHHALMKDISQWIDDGYYSPGRYKDTENFAVRSKGEVHSYLAPKEVPNAMQDLILKVNNMLLTSNDQRQSTHALTIATFFHQQFLNVIHPFADGNGRVGRILMNIILLKLGYPPVFITSVNREAYLDCFEQDDPDRMLEFMADRMIDSLAMKKTFAEGLTLK